LKSELPMVDSDRDLSLNRRLKNIVTNEAKDFSEAQKCTNQIIKTNRSKKNNENVDESLNLAESVKTERLAIEKKIKERKKMITKFGEYERKANSSNDLILDETNNIKSRKLIPMEEKIYKLVSKLFVIMKFIKNLRNAAFVRIPNKYQLNRMHILNDNCFFKEALTKSMKNQNDIQEKCSKCIFLSHFLDILMKFCSYFIKICQFLYQKIRKYFVVFDPEKTLRSVWDAIHLLVFCFYFFKIPIEISFDVNLFSLISEFDQTMAIVLNYFGVFFLFFDIIVNFNTGYYTKGYLIVSRKMIAKNYLKSSFVYDFISFLAVYFDFLQLSISGKFKLLFFFRVSNFFRIFSRIEESIHINFNLFNLLTLLKVVFRIVLLSHIFACGWHYISYVELDQTSETW